MNNREFKYGGIKFNQKQEEVSQWQSLNLQMKAAKQQYINQQQKFNYPQLFKIENPNIA